MHIQRVQPSRVGSPSAKRVRPLLMLYSVRKQRDDAWCPAGVSFLLNPEPQDATHVQGGSILFNKIFLEAQRCVSMVMGNLVKGQ